MSNKINSKTFSEEKSVFVVRFLNMKLCVTCCLKMFTAKDLDVISRFYQILTLESAKRLACHSQARCEFSMRFY